MIVDNGTGTRRRVNCFLSDNIDKWKKKKDKKRFRPLIIYSIILCIINVITYCLLKIVTGNFTVC